MSDEEKEKLKHTFNLFTQAITKLGEAKITLYGAGDVISVNKLPIGLHKIIEKQIHIAELIEHLEKSKLNITKLLGS